MYEQHNSNLLVLISQVFPKGSPLVPDISRGILKVIEGDVMVEIEKKWFGDQVCLNEGSTVSSNNLTFCSFWGLFLITGGASTCVLFISLIEFFYKNWNELRSIDPDKPIWQRVIAWFKYYNRRDLSSYTFQRNKIVDPDSGITVNGRYAASIKSSSGADNSSDRSSISYLSDIDSCLQEEETTSMELPSPLSRDPLVPTEVTS